MKITGNTILITGGGSGIGRGLAESFHKQGNQVVIAGRRQQVLDEVTAANPGMKSILLDINDRDSIHSFSERVAQDYPGLNVLINNAGIMKAEDLKSPPDYLEDAEEIVTTNLLGPIRLTAALLPLLQSQPQAAILTVSSGLAFVPLAETPTYSATKSAIHSYSISLRHQLKGTTTEVIEIIPPYVQTHLTGEHQANDPNAMPLDEFISEVMDILSNQPTVEEIVVERCKPLRFAAENGNADTVFQSVNPSTPQANTEHLRHGDKLRVTIISPGFVQTNFAEGVTNSEVKAQLEAYRDKFAMPPDAIARAVAFAIKQLPNVDVNEIVIRPTVQV